MHFWHFFVYVFVSYLRRTVNADGDFPLLQRVAVGNAARVWIIKKPVSGAF